jgi:NADH-quinone oxidoreductase subunit M
MPALHFPWLDLSIIVPAMGCFVLSLLRDREKARNAAIVFSLFALLFAVGEWIDFSTLNTFEAQEAGSLIVTIFSHDVLVVDELSAPLLPLTALGFFLVVLSTLKSKHLRFPFSKILLFESILLGVICCRASWILIVLLIILAIPAWQDLKARKKNPRMFSIHMTIFAILISAGYGLTSTQDENSTWRFVGVSLITGAALLRSGVIPLHGWMMDLFEKASFGTSILFVVPLTGAIVFLRFVLPIAPVGILQSAAWLSLATALYAAGMATVQDEARRTFAYLFLSNSSLVLVGIELVAPIGVTGALCIWISVGISLLGFGICLRSVEGRIGRVSLKSFHGLFESMPSLAGFFLLTGLASIGFPGTVGFIAMELLIEGAVEYYPLVGAAVVITGAWNGITILRTYFRIFTGKSNRSTVPIGLRTSERLSILILSVLILCGGFMPQLVVIDRYHAVIELNSRRTAAHASSTSHSTPVPESEVTDE